MIEKTIRKSRTYKRGLAAYYSRLELLKLLSPNDECQKCGKIKDDLEIHHIDGRDYCIKKLNRWTRVKRYWQEYGAGVRLAAWCKNVMLHFIFLIEHLVTPPGPDSTEQRRWCGRTVQ